MLASGLSALYVLEAGWCAGLWSSAAGPGPQVPPGTARSTLGAGGTGGSSRRTPHGAW